MKNTFILTLLLLLSTLETFAQLSNFDEGLKSFDAKDYKKAVELLKPYADNGNCIAQFVIGYTYQYGLSVEKNDTLAIQWLLKAAEQKQPAAMGPLAAALFSVAQEKRENLIETYKWANLAAEYVETQKFMTTRYVIKGYMKEEEIQAGDKLVEQYKKKWKKEPDCN